MKEKRKKMLTVVRALAIDAGGYGERMMLDADGGRESV